MENNTISTQANPVTRIKQRRRVCFADETPAEAGSSSSAAAEQATVAPAPETAQPVVVAEESLIPVIPCPVLLHNHVKPVNEEEVINPDEDPVVAMQRRDQNRAIMIRGILDNVMVKHQLMESEVRSRKEALSSTTTPVLTPMLPALLCPRPAQEIVPDEAPVMAAPVLRAPVPVRVSVPTSASIRAPALAPIGADVSALAPLQPIVADEDEDMELPAWEIEERMARNAYVPPPTAYGRSDSPSIDWLSQ